MIIQDRDLKLFRLLIRFGVLSTPQIRSLAFPGVTPTTVLRRLRVLEHGRYISRGVTMDDATNTWIIGSKGIQAVGFGNQYHFTNRNGIQHDVLLTDVRIALERLNLGKDWTPEFEIRAARMRNEGRTRHPPLIPDGLIVESIGGQSRPIAMELELTRKSAKRYDKILEGYSAKSLHRIWYIVKHLGTANAIINAANAQRGHQITSWLWFSLLDDLLKGHETSRIYSWAAKKWINFADVGFDAFKIPTPAHTSAQGVSILKTEKSVVHGGRTLANSEEKTENQPPGGGTVSGPDHTPPTTGGVWSGPETVKNEEKEGGVDKYKKCG
jgi:hypothetical protein